MAALRLRETDFGGGTHGTFALPVLSVDPFGQSSAGGGPALRRRLRGVGGRLRHGTVGGGLGDRPSGAGLWVIESCLGTYATKTPFLHPIRRTAYILYTLSDIMSICIYIFFDIIWREI